MRVLCVFAQCFLTAALLMAQGQPTPEESIQARNKAVAMRVFDEIFNQGKFEVAAEIYSPDFQNHGLHRSVDLKTDQEAVHAEKKAFPDLRMSVQQMIAEGDKVAVLWTLQGTHTGSGYAGLPPTGTRVEVRGITIWRIVDGRIVEEWSSFSETGGLPPNVCPSEVVVGVGGVTRPYDGDHYRTSCLEDGQKDVRLAAAPLNLNRDRCLS